MSGPYRQQVFFETVSQVTSDPDVQVGTQRQVGEDTYVYCYNAGNSDLPPTHLCIVSAVTGYSVTVSSVSNDVSFGHCKHTTLTTGTYGWILRRGFAQIEMNADQSTVIGGFMATSGDGTYTRGNLTNGNIVGKVMEAIASGASGAAYLDFGGM